MEKDQERGKGWRKIEDLTNTTTGQPMKTTEGTSPNRDNSSYTCQICHDIRWVYPPGGRRAVPCSCMKNQLQEEKRQRMLRLCEIPPKGMEWTFETFERLPDLEEAYQAALDVANSDGEDNWLMLMGGCGTGKTHLIMAICHYWLNRGKPARYMHITGFLEELRRGFRREGNDSYIDRYDLALNIPLLALDDLGTEDSRPWVQEKLHYLVDYRLVHKLAMVITTNQPWEDLPFRIQSRFERNARVVYISAPDYLHRENRHR